MMDNFVPYCSDLLLVEELFCSQGVTLKKRIQKYHNEIQKILCKTLSLLPVLWVNGFNLQSNTLSLSPSNDANTILGCESM